MRCWRLPQGPLVSIDFDFFWGFLVPVASEQCQRLICGVARPSDLFTTTTSVTDVGHKYPTSRFIDYLTRRVHVRMHPLASIVFNC